MSPPSGRWGIWSTSLRFRDTAEVTAAAAELDRLGYSALWMTGGMSDPFPRVAELLAATERLVVATAILSIWTMPATEVAAAIDRLPDAHHRFLFGLGVSHASVVDRRSAGAYDRPLSRLEGFLDELDATGVEGAQRDHRALAALGPRMLAVARDRSVGAHPYLTTPEHTARARAALGERAFLAPTQMVVPEADPTRARTVARRYLAMYLDQPNYRNSWQRLGLTDEDTSDGGSDRLVDALVAWGDSGAIVARLRAHLDAGADHVAISVLDPEATWKDQSLPRDVWAELAEGLRD